MAAVRFEESRRASRTTGGGFSVVELGLKVLAMLLL